MAHRKRKCLNCKSYHPVDEGIVCNLGFFHNNDCRFEYGMKNSKKIVEKVREDKSKKHRKELREYRGNDKSKRLKEAQRAFNAFVRKRDEMKSCISCGRVEVEWTRGGSWDCGHYLGVGAHPELRFIELNAHKQCKSCNGGSGKYAKKNHTVQQSYRVNLIERIGIKKVEWLEGKQDAKHYCIDDLREIEKEYKKKLKNIL